MLHSSQLCGVHGLEVLVDGVDGHDALPRRVRKVINTERPAGCPAPTVALQCGPPVRPTEAWKGPRFLTNSRTPLNECSICWWSLAFLPLPRLSFVDGGRGGPAASCWPNPMFPHSTEHTLGRNHGHASEGRASPRPDMSEQRFDFPPPARAERRRARMDGSGDVLGVKAPRADWRPCRRRPPATRSPPPRPRGGRGLGGTVKEWSGRRVPLVQMGGLTTFPGTSHGAFPQERSCGFFLGGRVEGVVARGAFTPYSVPGPRPFLSAAAVWARRRASPRSLRRRCCWSWGPAAAGGGGRRRTGAWLRARGGFNRGAPGRALFGQRCESSLRLGCPYSTF